MIKTKKTQFHAPLIVTGYILFALLIASVLLSTVVPMGKMLFDPRALQVNVAFMMVALTVGSLLPAFLGYAIGDRSVKTRSRSSHHFNGVLFGLLSFWVMLLVPSLLATPDELLPSALIPRMLIVNLVPSIGVALITVWLAIAHVRSRQAKHDVIEYEPYAVVLIASIFLLPLGALVNNLMSGSGVHFYSFVPFLLLAAFGGVSFATLRHRKVSRLSRLVWGAVSVSVAYVATFVSMQFIQGVSYYFEAMPTMEFQNMVNVVALVLALAGWAAYWTAQVKSLPKKSRR